MVVDAGNQGVVRGPGISGAPDRARGITRRTALKTLGAGAGGMMLLGSCGSGDEPAESQATGGERRDERLNVLVVVADDMRYDELSFVPTVERWRDNGLDFVNARQPTPLCTPARMSTLRGQYVNGPNGHGVSKLEYQPSSTGAGETVGAWLHAAGVTTGVVGKYLVHRTREARPGWDVWRTTFGDQAAEPRGYTIVTNETGSSTLIEPDQFQDEYLADQAVAFVETAPQPWFLYYCPNSPHYPWSPSGENASRYDDVVWDERDEYLWRGEELAGKPSWIRALPPPTDLEWDQMRDSQRRRLGELADLDAALARIADGLESTGQNDRTLVIFTSDNGVHLLEHRLPTGAKNTPYEPSMHVPLIVAGPGIEPQRVVTPVNAAADVTATCLAVEGATASLPQDGLDLLDVAAEADPDRAVLGFVDFDPGRRTPLPVADIVYTVDRKLVRYRDVAEEDRYEAYDLDADPGELHNWAAEPERRAERDQLEARLDQLLATGSG